MCLSRSGRAQEFAFLSRTPGDSEIAIEWQVGT